MGKEQIEEIEKKIQAASLDDDKKKQLLELLGNLKEEVGELADTNEELAKAIAGRAEASAKEAISEEDRPELLDLAVKELNESVEGFELSHPKLVRVVNSISVMLSNLGI